MPSTRSLTSVVQKTFLKVQGHRNRKRQYLTLVDSLFDKYYSVLVERDSKKKSLRHMRPRDIDPRLKEKFMKEFYNRRRLEYHDQYDAYEEHVRALKRAITNPDELLKLDIAISFAGQQDQDFTDPTMLKAKKTRKKTVTQLKIPRMFELPTISEMKAIVQDLLHDWSSSPKMYKSMPAFNH